MEIKTGMAFALETYCPATDGFSAARIERRSWSPTPATR
jgi:Xaa-Pro dipeptidase